MSEDVRVLFRELAGLTPSDRQSRYARERVSAAVRDELESLFSFDTTGESITEVVRGAAEDFLLSGAPLTGDRRCGPYRLIRLLGNGGMGAVYLAERVDGEVEQLVAIKFLRSGRDHEFSRQRFLRERQILASLNHPGIARLVDAGHTAGQPYLVMEHVEGAPIDRYAAGLGLRETIALVMQVGEAVSYAHRNLIIHRDLKPSNILVDGSGRPKLLDFGIAKLIDTGEETQTFAQAMTPEYASPEQLRGASQTTTSDVYSLAAVLYRLLTGRKPRELARAAKELPKDLACILAKAMREEPEARYGSVDLMIEDLRAYLDHRPVQARRGNALYHARKFARRHWIPMAGFTLALIGIAGGVWLADRERAVAEWRFQQVRQLSKQFLDLDSEIRSLPGSTKARNRIVAASLQYLGRLSAEPRRAGWTGMTTQDVDLSLEIAGAYVKVARVQGIPVNSNLGQFAQAKESLAKANTFVESVLALPERPQRARALLLSAEIARDSTILADSENREADTMAYASKTGERLASLLAAPDITAEQSAAAAAVYSNLALTYCNRHRLDEATAYARKGVEIARAGKDERQLGRLLGVLANTSRFAGGLNDALTAIRSSRAIHEKLADPNNVESMLQLSGALWREGLILGELNAINLDRPREAEPLLQRALDIAEGLARKDPDDYTSRSYVSMAGRELGDVLRDGQPARSLAVYDQALGRLGEVKNNPKARREEVWLLAGSSYALRKLGRAPEARNRIDAAMENLRKLKEYPARSVEPGGECDAALRALADHYAATGDQAAAIRAYRELQEKLMAANPHPESDLRHANVLSRLYRDLGAIYRKAGQPAEAMLLDQQRLDLWREWDRRLPGNPFITRQLAELRQFRPAFSLL